MVGRPLIGAGEGDFSHSICKALDCGLSDIMELVPAVQERTLLNLQGNERGKRNKLQE
jgi:hypothetical protein